MFKSFLRNNGMLNEGRKKDLEKIGAFAKKLFKIANSISMSANFLLKETKDGFLLVADETVDLFEFSEIVSKIKDIPKNCEIYLDSRGNRVAIVIEAI